MLKQPKGISIFFLTEMWERYGFNMIEILLVLYLIGIFKLGDTFSYGVLGSFTALAYVSAIVGGHIADYYLGHRRAILLGALLLSCAYGVMAYATHYSLICFALSLLAMGTGLLKPNVSSLLGSLYQKNDVRRHSGFTVFYVGINFGALIGLVIPSYIQQYFGWHVAYLSGLIVLLVAFVTFLVGCRYFRVKDFYEIQLSISRYVSISIFIIVTILVGYLIITYQGLADTFFLITGVASLLIVLYYTWRESGRARSRMLAYLCLLGISVIYWALYFQIFFSMNLFVNRAVSHDLFGFHLTTSSFAAFESIGVILFGWLLGKVWTAVGYSRWNPTTPMKFALGMLVHTLAFGLLVFSNYFIVANHQVRPEFIIAVYLIIAVGELFLSPTGLSMVTELVPQRVVGMMMGIFFITLGLGGKLAGVFADFSAIPKQMVSINKIEQVYHHAFFIYFCICLGAMLVSFALVPLVKRLITTPANLMI